MSLTRATSRVIDPNQSYSVPFVINSSVPGTIAAPDRAGLIVRGEGTNVGGRVGLHVASNTEMPTFIAYRSRGTLATPTAVQANDILNRLVSLGWTGTQWAAAEGVWTNADANWTDTSTPSNIVFFTNPVNTVSTSLERMRITPNGFVGINTTNPTTARLVVEQASNVSPGTAIKFGTKGYLVSVDTLMSHNAYWNGSAWINTENGTSGAVGFENATGNFYVNTAPAAASPTFTNRLTILNTNGNVGIGGVVPSIRLHVSGDIGASGDVFASYSDERLKTFLGKIPNALDKVNSLNGYYYKENEKAKEFGYENDKVQVGVNAQEVEKVLPEVIALAPFDMSRDEEGNLVSKSGENYKTVGYDKLVPLLIEAIKELSDKVKTLEAKINS